MWLLPLGPLGEALAPVSSVSKERGGILFDEPEIGEWCDTRRKALHFGIQSDRAEYSYCAVLRRERGPYGGQNRSKRTKVRGNPPKAQFAAGLARMQHAPAPLRILNGGFRLDVATTPKRSPG
jgi:hypothetical protein